MRVVDEHAYGPPRPGLEQEERLEGFRPCGRETVDVLPEVRASCHAAIVEAGGDGGDAEGGQRGQDNGEEVARGDEPGAEAVVCEAAAELQHGVEVALHLREGKEQDMAAAAV